MLATFYILAFNHEDMIADAINAAFAQTYSPLQIIISDDCSTDSTWEVIQRTVSSYKGPHRVETRRNVVNLGISLHINALWKECLGEWIIASAGDDTSLPTRVEKIVDAVKYNPNIKLIQSWLNEVDEKGNFLEINRLGVDTAGGDKVLFSIDDRLAGKAYAAHGAAMAYSRDIFDLFEPLPKNVIFEDNIVNIRAELLGVTMVLTTALVNHKNHPGQITRTQTIISSTTREKRRALRLTSDINSTHQNLKDIRRALYLSREHRQVLEDIYLEKFTNLQQKKIAVIGRWPLKLISLCRLIGKKSEIILSNDDLMRAVMPYVVYRLAKKINK